MSTSLEAELWSLLDEGPTEAARRPRARIAQRPWRHPNAFSAALGRAVQPAVRPAVVERQSPAPRPCAPAQDEPLHPEAADLLRELLVHVKRPLTAETASLAEECARRAFRDAALQLEVLSAVTSAADAGDAGFVFDRLKGAWDLLDEAARAELSRWMVENGTGELRSRGFEPLVIRMTHALSRSAPALAARLLIAGFSGDGRCPAVESGTPREELAVMLVGAVETADPSCVADIVEVVPANMRGDVLDAAFREGVPGTRAALEAAMASGELSDGAAVAAWQCWARSPRTASLRPRNAHVARLALAQVVRVAGGGGLGVPDAIAAVVRAAVELLAASEWEAPLAQLLGSPAVVPVIAHALDTVLGAGHPYSGRSGHGATRAMMVLLRSRVVEPSRGATRSELAAVEDSIQWLVRDPRLREPGTPGDHLEPLLRGVTRLVLDPDLDEAQVEVKGQALHLRSQSIEGLISPRFSLEEQRRLAELFVIHELAHLVQGIGRKDDVRAIRTRGLLGEMTLMQLDLAADHLAAGAAAVARYEGALVDLKDLQARSLVMFPFAWPQGASSRRRKSLRLASLMLDVALRRAHPDLMPDHRYLALDAQPRSGEIHVLEIDELVRVHIVAVEPGISDSLVRAVQLADELEPFIGRLAQAVADQW